jgi:hypothetical protein
MAVVVRLTETMRGTHHFVDSSLGNAEDRKFYFRIQWGGAVSSVLNPLSPDFLRYDADGIIFVEGLDSSELRCKGSLELDYLREHKLTYRLNFEHQGRLFRYTGEKTNVRLTHPVMLVKTHTTCYGRIVDDQSRIVSKSVAHFEPESIAEFLTSFRLSRA